MTEEHERGTSVPPARPPIRDDGWWHTIIDALLEELDGPRDERERGPGR